MFFSAASESWCPRLCIFRTRTQSQMAMTATLPLTICVVWVDHEDDDHVFSWSPNPAVFGSTPPMFRSSLRCQALSGLFDWFESIASKPDIYDDTENDSATFVHDQFGSCFVAGDGEQFYKQKQWDWVIVHEPVISHDSDSAQVQITIADIGRYRHVESDDDGNNPPSPAPPAIAT